jgi:hypothetical protein
MLLRMWNDSLWRRNCPIRHFNGDAHGERRIDSCRNWPIRAHRSLRAFDSAATDIRSHSPSSASGQGKSLYECQCHVVPHDNLYKSDIRTCF